MIEIEFEINEDDVLAAGEYSVNGAYEVQTRNQNAAIALGCLLIIYSLTGIPAYLALAPIVNSAPAGELITALLIFGVIFHLIFIGYWAVWWYGLSTGRAGRKAGTKFLENFRLLQALGPKKVILGEIGMRFVNHLCDDTVPWQAIRFVDGTANHLYFMACHRFYFVPTRAFLSQGKMRSFLQFIRESAPHVAFRGFPE